jgi:hypothetical protein
MWIKLFTTIFFKHLCFSRLLHLTTYQLYYFSSYSLTFVCRKALLPLCPSFFEKTWKFRCSEMCNMNVGSSDVMEKCIELERSQLGFTWNQIVHRWSLCVFCNTLKHIKHVTLLFCLYIKPLLNKTSSSTSRF